MEYNPTEYYQHPLPVLALVGLNPPTSSSSPTESTKELEEKDLPEGQDAEDQTLSTSKHPLTATTNSKSQLIATATKKITEMLGVNLPPSLWEPGRITKNSSTSNSPKLGNFGLSNRNPSINTGLPSLMASSDRVYTAILGDKSTILPTKRAKSTPGVASTHSTLSPLSPVSPLYPDGLMTPLWMRRHFLDFPGVIIAFYELWLPEEEVSRLSQSSAPANSSNSYRERDAALAAEINESRKSAIENNVKFAAVIWNLSHNDGDVKADRLSSIRKGGGLDLRTSFFVLDRRNAENLAEFLSGILKVTLDPALQRYRDQYRRVKRKQARFSSHPQINPPALGNLGWLFRYEFKLAHFSLVRGDAESATAHFESAYCGLSELLCDNNVGKRWDDASALIDSISFQICRVCLYKDDGLAALLQLQRHIRGFGPLLGAGNRNAWMSQQFRLFADLLDWAIRSGKKFAFGQTPVPPAGLFQLGSQASWRRSIRTPLDDSPSIYPLGVLQHPGYYYYEAARSLTGPDQSQAVIEILSKSYEQFKRNHGDRMTLKVASAIADAYLQSDKYDLAIKFYDRIAKAYRKEPWPQLLCAALQQALVCAQKLGLRDTLLRHSIELLSPSFTMDAAARQDLLTQLVATLELPYDGPQPPADQKLELVRLIEIDMVPASSFLSVSVGFESATAIVGNPVSLQIHACASLYPGAELQASSIDVAFSDASFNFCISNLAESQDLGLKHNLPLVLKKTLVVNQATELKVTSLTIHVTSARWDLALKFDGLCAGLGNVFPLVCRVHLPPPLLKVHMTSPNPAYLNEALPVDIHLHSDEAEPIEVSISHTPKDGIHIEPFSAPETIPCHVIKHATKRIYVVFSGTEGVQELAIKAQFTRGNSSGQAFEIHAMLNVNVELPFKCHFKCYPLSGLSCPPPPSLFQSLAPAQNLRRKIMLTCHLTPAETLLVHKLELVTNDKSSEIQALSHGAEWEDTWQINHLIEANIPIASPSDPHPKWILNIGHLKIRWQRPDAIASEFFIKVPPIELNPLRIAIELSYPSLLLEGEPFTLVYTIANTTLKTEEVVCRIDASELPLVYAGWRVVTRRLLPSSVTKFTVTCHALAYGRFAAPRFTVERKDKANDNTTPLGLTYGWAPEAPILLIKPHHPQSAAMLSERVVT